MTVHEGASTHDGLGRAALVRRFKTLKPSHKVCRAGPVGLVVPRVRVTFRRMAAPTLLRTRILNLSLGQTHRKSTCRCGPAVPG